MKMLSAAAVVLLLAGCASAPRPHMMVLPHKAPVVKVAPAAVVEAPKPPTFKERFKKFRGRLRWVH